MESAYTYVRVDTAAELQDGFEHLRRLTQRTLVRSGHELAAARRMTTPAF